MRPLTFTDLSLKKWIVIAIAFLAFGNILAQNKLSLSARFTGTWKRDDGDETVTLKVNPDAVDGDAVIITNSNGVVGTGILKGERIVYTGAIEAEGGAKAKVAGAYMVSPDASSLIKLRKIILLNGTKDDTVTYVRVTPIVSATPVPAIPPPLIARPEDENKETTAAQPAASATATIPVGSSTFSGNWKPADDSAKLGITINGHNVSLKYSPGPRESGTIRASKIECEPLTSGDGTSDTDTFEMSPNGRTLIRRRTVQSPKGETAHETLTYSRTE